VIKKVHINMCPILDGYGVIQNYDNEYVRGIGQGEVIHRKYKRLKPCGSHAYDRSSGSAAVVAQDT
jgi:hypothetical protein